MTGNAQIVQLSRLPTMTCWNEWCAPLVVVKNLPLVYFSQLASAVWANMTNASARTRLQDTFWYPPEIQISEVFCV
jgi:hypothetical protein